MKKIKDIPVGILLFVVFIAVFDISYFYLLITQGPRSVLFTFSIVSLGMWTDVLLTTILLFVVSYGFLNGKNWARQFALFYFSWSIFWDIVMIINRHEIIARYLLFIIYVVLITYLLMSDVKSYFGKTPKVPHEKNKVYKHGEYTLFSKIVKLKSGKLQIIYFFSKRPPKSGTPCELPHRHKVKVSKRSGMPYLKKKR